MVEVAITVVGMVAVSPRVLVDVEMLVDVGTGAVDAAPTIEVVVLSPLMAV